MSWTVKQFGHRLTNLSRLLSVRLTACLDLKKGSECTKLCVHVELSLHKGNITFVQKGSSKWTEWTIQGHYFIWPITALFTQVIHTMADSVRCYSALPCTLTHQFQCNVQQLISGFYSTCLKNGLEMACQTLAYKTDTLTVLQCSFKVVRSNRCD
jgi:hypothetical protein